MPEDYKKAAIWYRMAAEEGNAAAQALLGTMYYKGIGMPQDYQKAAKWCRLAAEQGNASAQALITHMYSIGEAISKGK